MVIDEGLASKVGSAGRSRSFWPVAVAVERRYAPGWDEDSGDFWLAL